MEWRELVRQDPHFSWLPEEAFRILDACFDMHGETVPAGETRETGGRIGYLLRGSGTLNGTAAEPGTLFGARRTDREEKEMAPAALTVATDCDVLWFQFDVVNIVCYQACWFHARLVQELERLMP